MIINMEEAFRCFPMLLFIRANTSTGNQKESGSISGLMDNFIKGSGSMASNMAQECGREPKVIAMLESGEWEKLKAMECMSGSMVTDMKEISRIV